MSAASAAPGSASSTSSACGSYSSPPLGGLLERPAQEVADRLLRHGVAHGSRRVPAIVQRHHLAGLVEQRTARVAPVGPGVVLGPPQRLPAQRVVEEAADGADRD